MSDLSRRGFLASTSATVALQLGRPMIATADESWRNSVRSDFWFDRLELPREANAFAEWEAALNSTQSLDDLRFQAIARLDRGADFRQSRQLGEDFSAAMDSTKPFPDGLAGRILRSWHQSSIAAFSLIDDGIRLGQYQLPAEHLEGFLRDGSSDPARRPIEFARWLTVAFNIACHDQDWAAADRTILNLLAMAKMVLQSDGYAVHRLFHSNPLYRAVDAILSRLRAAPMTLASKKHIADALTDCELAVQSWPNTVRMELCHFGFPQLATLPPASNLRLFIDAVLQQTFRFPSGLEKALAENQAVRQIRDGMQQLFDDHSRPFDLQETIRMISDVAATMIEDRDTPWLKRQQGPTDAWLNELEPWPAALRFRGNDRVIHEMFFGPDKSEPSISVDEISAARAALLKVSNPIGKLIAVHDLDGSIRSVCETGMLNIDAARCGLAICQFRDRHLKAPASLSEVVDGQFLKAIPMDPFSGEPLKYDPVRGIVWSFGTDERDDGGHKSADAKWFAGDDFVWSMPV